MPNLNWAQWTLLGLYAFSVIWAVATVGQKRDPRTPREAVLGLVVTGAMAFLVVKAGAS